MATASTPGAPSPPIALVVHGHFYQPPRENPWTDEVTREPSAAPAHDWNERILTECYRANAFARLYGERDRVRALVNNYAQLSFNVGPTLARWIERRDATTIARMRAGDEEQRRRLGHGGALAQVWGHPIAPLLSPRDRRTQILWGLQDFEQRFGRKAEGMWLPETGVDGPTLEALIDAGVAYTILAPEQIAAVRGPGDKWKSVNRDTLDTGRPYRWQGSGVGRSIALAVFDGPFSRELAFGNAARDSASFLAHVKASADRSAATGVRMVLAASDGELYGHHKKFADLTLAHAATLGAAKAGIEVTNLGALLAAAPPSWDAELAQGPGGEGTAWSCGHGLGRWQRHCGCAMRSPDESGWSQAWRTPLRAALDVLRDRAAAQFEDAAGELFTDPWAVRDAYGAVLDASPEERLRFIGRQPGPSRRRGEAGQRRGLLLLEAQRSALLMYASCGWFFDDVAGVESALVIRQAAFVLDLLKQVGLPPPTREVLERLAEAKSNLPGAGTGADVFQRVSRHRTTAVHTVAALSFAELTGAGDASLAGPLVPGFTVEHDRKASRRDVVKGRATVRHLRTGEEATLAYEARARTPLELSCKVGKEVVTPKSLPDEAREPIALTLLARLVMAPKVSVRDCRRALELARSSASGEEKTGAMFHPGFGDLLPRLLEVAPAASADDEMLVTVAEVLDAVPETVRAQAHKRAQEWAFAGLAAAREGRKGASPELRALGEKLDLAVDDILASTSRPAEAAAARSAEVRG
jgi:alpha-amylase/alpha-mannosidase (GH57 family)